MKKRLDLLSERIKALERDYDDFDRRLKEDYIGSILKKYDALINFLCKSSYYKLRLNFVDSDDLKQEFLEYLLKWTYCEFKRKILEGSNEIWIPFIKRSFRNFIINFQISYKKGGKRRPVDEISSLSDMESSFVEGKFGFKSDDLHEILELNECIVSFYSKIDIDLDRRVFDLLYNPSESFRMFTLENYKDLSMFEMIAKYIGSSYSSVLKSFKRLRESFLTELSFSLAL